MSLHRWGVSMGTPALWLGAWLSWLATAWALSPPVEAVHGWLAAALLTVVTGLGYATLLGARGSARLAISLGSSALAVLAVFVALRVLGVPPRPAPVAAGLCLAGGLPLLWSKGRGELRLPWSFGVPALGSLLALTWFAWAVVPPLDDQDLEVQATAHALAFRQEPATVTDRGTTFFFAHPPLLHVFVAGSFALSGRLSDVKDADELAAAARLEQGFDPARADAYPPAYYDRWKILLSRFFAEPHLWPTRQVNVVLGSIAVGTLALFGARLSGSTALGLLVAATLATFPEFLIRGAYGGYFACPVLLSLLLLIGLDERWDGRALLGTSALAFLADQKGLLVPLSWAAALDLNAPLRRRLLPLAGGILGLLLFAAWGLLTDAPTFVHDFLRQHVLRRLSGADVRFASDAARWYPSIPELWREFADHYGLGFTVAAAFASARALTSRREAVRAAGVAVWIGAAVFSYTDWRQTKHLALLATPALIAVADAAAAEKRRLWTFILALFVLRNLWASWPLLSDFGAIRPSTIW